MVDMTIVAFKAQETRRVRFKKMSDPGRGARFATLWPTFITLNNDIAIVMGNGKMQVALSGASMCLLTIKRESSN